MRFISQFFLFPFFAISCLAAELPDVRTTPIEAQAVAIDAFIHRWVKENHPKQKWVWFLCVVNPTWQPDQKDPFLEPDPKLLSVVRSNHPNVAPFSMADPVPPEGSAYILEKGSGNPGAYLRLGLLKRFSSSSIEFTVAFFAGAHFGGGSNVLVKRTSKGWAVSKFKWTFVA